MSVRSRADSCTNDLQPLCGQLAAVRGAGDILPHPARRPRACGSGFGASFGCAAADEHACRSGDTAPGIRPPSSCQFVSLVQWTFLRTRLSQRLWIWRLCDWLRKPPGTHAMNTCNCAHSLFQAFSLDTQACLSRSSITAGLPLILRRPRLPGLDGDAFPIRCPGLGCRSCSSSGAGALRTSAKLTGSRPSNQVR